jgi:dipeptidyl aminopeptidase/acylaminoacyl peptidase
MMPSLPPTILSLTFLLSVLSPLSVTSAFTPTDLLSTPRSGPAIPNPNGTFAVYTESTFSFPHDAYTGGIFLLPISSSSSSPRGIVNDTRAKGPVWLDDRTVAYVFTRERNSELRTVDIQTGLDRRVQEFSGMVSDLQSLKVGGRTVRIAFSARTTTQGEIVRANESETPDVLVYDKLWVRHWDAWITREKNSIFSGTMKLDRGYWVMGDKPRNMLLGTSESHQLESPIPPWGGAQDFSISETHLAFVAKDPHLNPATNTAAHVYTVSFDEVNSLESVNRGPGASSSPTWSPDGKMLAYLEMRVRGYESDRIFRVNCAYTRAEGDDFQTRDARVYQLNGGMGFQSLFNSLVQGRKEFIPHSRANRPNQTVQGRRQREF